MSRAWPSWAHSGLEVYRLEQRAAINYLHWLVSSFKDTREHHLLGGIISILFEGNGALTDCRGNDTSWFTGGDGILSMLSGERPHRSSIPSWVMLHGDLITIIRTAQRELSIEQYDAIMGATLALEDLIAQALCIEP